MPRKLLVAVLALGLVVAACSGASAVTQQIATISPADAFQTIQAHLGDPNFVLLDVRTPEEYQAGRLAGAQEIDFYAADFRQQISQLDRTKEYLVYCHTGNRSGQTLTMMKDLGFGHVEDIAGGIAAWTQAGLPVSP
jgi:phage shock protein E